MLCSGRDSILYPNAKQSCKNIFELNFVSQKKGELLLRVLKHQLHSVLRGGGLSKLLFWENRCLDLLIGVGLSGDPLGAAFDPAILAIYGQK